MIKPYLDPLLSPHNNHNLQMMKSVMASEQGVQYLMMFIVVSPSYRGPFKVGHNLYDAKLPQGEILR